MDADVLHQLYMAGREQWPELELAFEPFAQHCTKLGGVSWSADEQVHAADLYLSCACFYGVALATTAFEREGAAIARAAIARVNHNPEFVQEVIQQLWTRLLLGPRPKVGDYAARGPLTGWLKVAATRAALDRLRAQRTTELRETELREIELNSAFPAEGLSPEIRLIQARYGNDFREAFDGALAALSARERNVLHMHVKGGCSIDRIGKAYDVHRATAARWLEQTRTKIYGTVRRKLRIRYGAMTDSEFRSLARVLRSDLDSACFEQSVAAD